MDEKHNHAGSPDLDRDAHISGLNRCRRPLFLAVLIVLLGAAVGAFLQAFPGQLIRAGETHSPDLSAVNSDLRRIVDDGTPRLVSTPAAAAGRARIREVFPAEVNFTDHAISLKRGVAGPVDLVNLVGRIKGTDPTAGTIAVVAHSDSVGVSPGAGDDASGVVVAAHVARALVQKPPRHDVIVLITDGEEAGLLGARVFMERHPWAVDLKAVLNLDARGAAGPAYVFEMGPNTGELVSAMSQHVQSPRTTSLAAWIYRQMPNSTDFTVFRRAGITGYNVAFIGDHPAYHTPQDSLERLSPSTMEHFVATGLALIRALDELGPWQNSLIRGGLEASATPADRLAVVNAGSFAGALEGGPGANTETAAWTDILGIWILSWPERLSALISLAASIAVVVPAFWRAARSVQAARAIGFVIGALLVAMVVAGLLGLGVRWGASAMDLSTHSAPGRTLALHILVWLTAAVLVACVGTLQVRRGESGEKTAFAGVWTVWAVVASAGGFLLPAASPLLVPPVACAAAGFLLGGFASTRRAVIWGSLAGLAGAMVAWMPLEPAFLDALGLTLAPVTAVRAVLLLSPAIPLVVLAVRAPDELTQVQLGQTDLIAIPSRSSHTPRVPR